jgi:hypothetical protein
MAAPRISDIKQGLSYSNFKKEFMDCDEVKNNPSLLGQIDNYWTAYSATEQSRTQTTGGTGKVTSATQSTVTGLLGTQDISRSGAGYQMSSLESGQDTIFQLSSISKGLFDVMNQSKNVGDVVMNLAGAGISEVMTGVQQILTQEVNLRNKINSQLGLTGELSREARNNIIETLPAATAMAFGFEDVSNYAVSLVENTGKMTTFGADVLQESQKTARAFYGDLDKLAGAIDGFEKVGIGAKDAIKEIDKAGKSSLALGLNARKVVSELDQNMSKLNSYGFKNGVEGLTRMVQKSIEFNLNMSTVLKLADDAMDPDKAIALSAELQAIGGAIGDFNDPLKLMYMATNDAGGLQDALIGVAGSLTTYNSELGKFEISGANLRKAKALASELGMNYEELANTAIKASERSSAATALLSSGLQIDEKEKEFLTNISKMEGGQMVIDVPKSLAKELGLEDTKVALDELSPAIAKGLIENQQAFEKMSVEDIARDQYTTTQNIQKDVSALLTLAKVRVAGGLREPLSQVDKYLEEKLGSNLKKTTTAELQGKEELGAFWKEVGKNAQGPMVKSFEELQKSGMISQDALKGVKSIGGGEQQVTTKNINLNIKSNDAVVDATTRAIVNNPSIANDIANTVLPNELDYTSTTLPTKFY